MSPSGDQVPRFRLRRETRFHNICWIHKDHGSISVGRPSSAERKKKKKKVWFWTHKGRGSVSVRRGPIIFAGSTRIMVLSGDQVIIFGSGPDTKARFGEELVLFGSVGLLTVWFCIQSILRHWISTTIDSRLLPSPTSQRCSSRSSRLLGSVWFCRSAKQAWFCKLLVLFGSVYNQLYWISITIG